MAVIETNNLVKRYGAITALDGVSLRVEKGQIFGLLGQNGAGKTTLIKILLGITGATAGGATILGEPAGSTSVRKRLGYLPEDHHFPEYHTAASLLGFYGSLLEITAEQRRRIPDALALVGLKSRMHYKVRTYSKGMKQRLGIAQAVFHDPEVLFLDEPTDGVDPVGRREIRQILLRLKEKGKTIFLNSHLLSEVELICDRVVILNRGLDVRAGTMEELTSSKGRWLIGLAPGQTFPVEEANAQGFAVTSSGAMWEVQLRDDQDIDAVVELVRSRGLNLRHLAERKATLEELFVATVDRAEPGIDAQPRRADVGGPDHRIRS